MKTQLIRAATALALCASLHQAAAQGTAFTYQGRLNDGGNAANGSYDLAFSLYTVDSGGSPAAGPLTFSATGVTNGLFTVALDFGPNVFSGGAFWLDISARTNGSGAFTELSPRQPLTASPYSIYSGLAAYATVADGVAGGVIGPNAFQVGAAPAPGQVLSYNGSLLAWTTLGSGGGGGGGWSLTGNSGTIPGTDFLGTTDDEPLEFWVNNSVALRLEPGGGSVNVVGGRGSSADSSASGATISGGVFNTIAASGNSGTIAGGFENTVSNLYATVGGGEYNAAGGNGATVGGGYNNTATGRESTVGGGAQNVASGDGSFVGGGGYSGTTVGGNTASGPADVVAGGYANTASATYSFVGGGAQNNASQEGATISGGLANTASALGATVPGGAQNLAQGEYSFAAGDFAEALNQGSFVWSDNQGTPFLSTADNQFSVRAHGGVRLVTGGNGTTGLTLDGYQVLTTAAGGGGGSVATNAWLLTGNAGANPAAGYFLGTIDTNSLELRVNSLRGLRLDPAFDGLNESINVNGGYWNNALAGGISGATIAGGGGDFHFINEQGLHLVVNSNAVTGSFGTVGGGEANVAGYQATVPGGYNNSATGNGSFAAGRNSHATFDGSFVWGDGSAGASDNAPDEFQVLATGGVGFYTGSANVNIVSSGQMTFGSSTRQMIDLYNASGFDYGIGVQAATLYQRAGSGGGFAWYSGGVHNNGQNNNGGGATLMTLDGSGNLNVTANASVCSLTIRGGCDLAEPFQISSANQEIPEGAVVVIDEENPGHLKLSQQPYDARVAGIVSGANGINPGIQMQQQGVLEGGKNVALSGRVYVQADASNGAIKPGDLLTTSATRGRAMKVTDHARAQGAILGKAMTGLTDGTGMVLVLVTLQ